MLGYSESGDAVVELAWSLVVAGAQSAGGGGRVAVQ